MRITYISAIDGKPSTKDFSRASTATVREAWRDVVRSEITLCAAIVHDGKTLVTFNIDGERRVNVIDVDHKRLVTSALV